MCCNRKVSIVFPSIHGNDLCEFEVNYISKKFQGFSLGYFLGKWPKDFENDLNFEDF